MLLGDPGVIGYTVTETCFRGKAASRKCAGSGAERLVTLLHHMTQPHLLALDLRARCACVWLRTMVHTDWYTYVNVIAVIRDLT